MMETIKNEVAVMFSGGIDSLLCAVLLQEQFEKVHLMTFDKGFLELGIRNNLRNVEKLKALFGNEKIIHNIVDIKFIFKSIAFEKFWKSFRIYGSEVAWCVACRISMNIGALIYALENNLKAYADGSNREQVPSKEYLAGTAENYPSVVQKLKDFASQYYVDFLTPAYEFGPRDKKRKKLKEIGLEIDYLSLDKAKNLKGLLTREVFSRSQPMCLSGWLIHWRRNLLGIPVKHDETKTMEFVSRKLLRVIPSLIREYFQRKDIAIQEMIRQRKSFLL